MFSFLTMWNVKEQYLHGGVIFSTSMALCFIHGYFFFLFLSPYTVVQIQVQASRLFTTTSHKERWFILNCLNPHKNIYKIFQNVSKTIQVLYVIQVLRVQNQPEQLSLIK